MKNQYRFFTSANIGHILRNTVMINYIKELISARIEAELENVMSVCIEAGKEIDAEIEKALKF